MGVYKVLYRKPYAPASPVWANNKEAGKRIISRVLDYREGTHYFTIDLCGIEAGGIGFVEGVYVVYAGVPAFDFCPVDGCLELLSSEQSQHLD